MYSETCANCRLTSSFSSPTASVKVSSSMYRCINIGMISSDEEIRRTVNVVFEKYDLNRDGYLELN